MKSKLYLPQNIFSDAFAAFYDLDEIFDLLRVPSPLISKQMSADENSTGLIPTLDLLTLTDVFVSSTAGISFNAHLSNAYLYFREGQDSVKEVLLSGDVSSNEAILVKILFKELYNIEVTTGLMTRQGDLQKMNILQVGDDNYSHATFINGLSFSEEIIELINAPYINFVIASRSEAGLIRFNDLKKKYDGKEVYEVTKSLKNDIPQISIDFIRDNFQHVIFDFDEQDIEGLRNLLQIPYYHGIIKDMIELKLV